MPPLPSPEPCFALFAPFSARLPRIGSSRRAREKRRCAVQCHWGSGSPRFAPDARRSPLESLAGKARVGSDFFSPPKKNFILIDRALAAQDLGGAQDRMLQKALFPHAKKGRAGKPGPRAAAHPHEPASIERWPRSFLPPIRKAAWKRPSHPEQASPFPTIVDLTRFPFMGKSFAPRAKTIRKSSIAQSMPSCRTTLRTQNGAAAPRDASWRLALALRAPAGEGRGGNARRML